MQKDWYISKGVWGGLLVIMATLCNAGAQWLATGSVDLVGLSSGVGVGLGLIGIRTAQK